MNMKEIVVQVNIEHNATLKFRKHRANVGVCAHILETLQLRIIYEVTCAPFIDRKLQDEHEENAISQRRALIISSSANQKPRKASENGAGRFIL